MKFTHDPIRIAFEQQNPHLPNARHEPSGQYEHQPTEEAWRAYKAGDGLASRFHEAYERLAPAFGYETRKDSAVPWSDVPESNKRLMTAVAMEVMHQAAARERELAWCLGELHALVKGECPSLLNEDSGGSEALDSRIRAALAKSKEGYQS